MLARPFDRVFEGQLPPDIDADPLAQPHAVAPRTWTERPAVLNLASVSAPLRPAPRILPGAGGRDYGRAETG